MRLPDPQLSRVVLIGTSSYADQSLADLPQVGASIRDLFASFTAPVGGVVPKVNCEVIADEGDLRLIGRKLRTAAKQAGDLLLVYFVGHGLIGKRYDLYLGLPDSELAYPEFNSLEYDKLRSAVLDSSAKTKVIILDCCFSGRAITETQAGEAALLGQLQVDGSYVLTAAGRNQVALILPGEEHTAFTGRFLTLLREGVPNDRELLTIEDIYQALRARMQAEGLSTPQKCGTDTAGLLALVRNQARAETEMDSPGGLLQITGLTVEETMGILRVLRARYEDHHQVTISEDAIKACATLSAERLPGPLPAKAIELMEQAVILRRPQRGNNAQPMDLRYLESEWAQIQWEREISEAEATSDMMMNWDERESSLMKRREAWQREGGNELPRITRDVVLEALTSTVRKITQH